MSTMRPRSEPSPGELPETPALKRRAVRIIGLLVIVAIIWYSLFVELPSHIDTAEVRSTLQALSAWDLIALVAAGLLVMLCLGWGSKASLPGLSLYRGTESSAVSQVTAFVVPPPGDMVVRFAMYRTYNFTDEQSAVAVLIALIARYAAVFFMPILGLALVLISGNGSWTDVWWLCGLSAVFVAAMVLLLRVIRSDGVAHTLGRWLQRVATRVIRLARRTPPTDLEDSVLEFSQRMRGTIDTNLRQLVAANVSWGLANCLVMLLALRMSGLGSDELSVSEVVLVTGAAMALNSVPIPGGFGLTEAGLLAIVSLSGAEATAAFTAALFLYRIATWLMPMPVGSVFFLAWRWRIRRETAASKPAAEAAPEPS
jgi:uncharacterized membrane protein YbhN (UPF0104 family)